MTKFPFLCRCIVGLCWLLFSGRDCCAAQNVDESGNYDDFPPEYLTSNSVILITGAAGFLGSELALALFQTYSPKRIICVDRMGNHPQSQKELALFEFQRQRSFHVLQTLKDKGRFYRVDFSPIIPEYYDLGEVPVLDHIFREHPDITHVVHLADPYPHSALQVLPREKEVPKAGMMEALLEQLTKFKREKNRLPHFVYSSSFEVYPYAMNATAPKSSSSAPMEPLTETQPLSTPSSLRGASKMIDEMLAKLYYDTREIYSVGLRFFTVYGPWGSPGSPIFEMADRAVSGDVSVWESDGKENGGHEIIDWKSLRTTIHDYVYISDAIDAVMAAMQFKPKVASSDGVTEQDQPPPVIFNVATGEGHTLDDIGNIMEEFFPPKKPDRATSQIHDPSSSRANGDEKTSMPLSSIGSTVRAEMFLGYKPQVTLRDGIIKTLSWHYDRAFPYGGSRVNKETIENDKINFISSQGIVSCLPYDKECLNAAPVFPCASECSHEAQCTKSYYDEVIGWTQALTSECETVLYTVDLDIDLASIPSAHLKVQTTSKSFLKGNCNLAFVAEQSRLVQSLRNSFRIPSFIGRGRDQLLRNGEWVLIPLNVPSIPEGGFSDGENNDVLKLLPKLSPGLFFGSATKRAVYIDSNILLDSIPKLLREASTQPYSEEMDGATALLIGRGTPKDYFAQQDEDEMQDRRQVLESTNTLVQNAAYRMVRIAVSDRLFGDGFTELLDSRWMVHTLQSNDGRLFRCDVLGEVVQWEVSTDRSALEFILGLHDMWSRVIAKTSGVGPWWIGDGVVTVPERHTMRRRLQDEDEDEDEDAESAEDIAVDLSRREEQPVAQGSGDAAKETEVKAEEGSDDDEAESEDEQSPADAENERGGEFVLDAGAQQEVAADEEKRGQSSDQDDDEAEGEGDEEEAADVERDFSSYDTWMGILSSSSVKFFVRIVPSSAVGVVSIDDH
jgi:UDP-glucuronate 4-epimerase